MTAVEIDYIDLISGQNLTAAIEKAFGNHESALGILTVKNIPNLQQARSKLLQLGFVFGNLDPRIQSKYEHSASNYSFGWSHGKERLEGKLDLAKGSYYANPIYDRPSADEELIQKYSEFVHPNIWPDEDLPQFKQSFKELGQVIVSVGTLVAKQCDAYIQSKCPSYEPNRLEKTITESICCKARLLHYYPKQSEALGSTNDDNSFSSWCGWHNDHGSLTGLVSAVYMNSAGEEVVNTDLNSGLYVCSRSGEIVKVVIPPDQVAFQIGETAQIHSGGILQATPHAVRGTRNAGISRETFAVFMEPNFNVDMNIPADCNIRDAQSQSSAKNLPPGVPPLATRWSADQTFAEFTKATLSAYY